MHSVEKFEVIRELNANEIKQVSGGGAADFVMPRPGQRSPLPQVLQG
jgi:hypothetical protein